MVRAVADACVVLVGKLTVAITMGTEEESVITSTSYALLVSTSSSWTVTEVKVCAGAISSPA